MTKHQRQREWNALSGVRAALHGWAFTHAEKLPSLVAAAERAKAALPEELHAAAEVLINPVRKRIEE